MDAATITALGGLLIAFGGGAWKLIDRADKKRERREVAVEDLLKARVASLEGQLQKQADDFDKERRRNKRYNSRIKAAAGRWREQLLVNDIQPDPADWPEDDHDDTE
ncbi:hypothetical protein [Paenarthrobacter sp. Y-19]|uniref:hypothetical protein n=1 Tax=Paenarthrobacter sp. Y-19 TaxID=3031125 RepID=UPI0023DBEC84|nr:hypothetical protein [Paenarthrobacter sp. Y-19]